MVIVKGTFFDVYPKILLVEDYVDSKRKVNIQHPCRRTLVCKKKIMTSFRLIITVLKWQQSYTIR